MINLLFLDQSQALLSERGPLAEVEQFEGLYRISLRPPIEAGRWRVDAKSDGRLTFKVIGINKKIKKYCWGRGESDYIRCTELA